MRLNEWLPFCGRIGGQILGRPLAGEPHQHGNDEKRRAQLKGKALQLLAASANAQRKQQKHKENAHNREMIQGQV